MTISEAVQYALKIAERKRKEWKEKNLLSKKRILS